MGGDGGAEKREGRHHHDRKDGKSAEGRSNGRGDIIMSGMTETAHGGGSSAKEKAAGKRQR